MLALIFKQEIDTATEEIPPIYRRNSDLQTGSFTQHNQLHGFLLSLRINKRYTFDLENIFVKNNEKANFTSKTLIIMLASEPNCIYPLNDHRMNHFTKKTLPRKYFKSLLKTKPRIKLANK